MKEKKKKRRKPSPNILCHSVIILGKSQIYRRHESGRDLWIPPSQNHLLKPGSERSDCIGLWISPKTEVSQPPQATYCVV